MCQKKSLTDRLRNRPEKYNNRNSDNLLSSLHCTLVLLCTAVKMNFLPAVASGQNFGGCVELAPSGHEQCSRRRMNPPRRSTPSAAAEAAVTSFPIAPLSGCGLGRQGRSSGGSGPLTRLLLSSRVSTQPSRQSSVIFGKSAHVLSSIVYCYQSRYSRNKLLRHFADWLN